MTSVHNAAEDRLAPVGEPTAGRYVGGWRHDTWWNRAGGKPQTGRHLVRCRDLDPKIDSAVTPAIRLRVQTLAFRSGAI